NTGHNIVATVFIEAGSMYRADGPEEDRCIGEVEFVNGVAAMSASGLYGKTRVCAGIVGQGDLRLGDRVRPVLEKLIAAGNGRLRGVRFGVCWDTGKAAKFGRYQLPPHLVLDPVFRKGFAHLKPLGLSFESWQFHPQLSDLPDLLRAFPETSVILNHVGGVLGIPPHDNKREEIFETWRKSIRELAQFPNLTVKLGGLGMLYTDWDFHLRDIPPASEELAQTWRPYIETCIEAFGPDRCMMESNFPVDKQSCGYGVLWNAMKRITQNCSAADKAKLYQDTAARVYRLSV
ncbi:MAG: amidohydrolase family protein, partial [Burkholderiales bacterium]